MIDALYTPRLLMQPLAADDLEGVFAIFSDPEAMAFFSGVKSRADTNAWIENAISQYQQNGFGQMAVCDRNSGEFLGYCGLVAQEILGQNRMELAYSIRRKFWNRGYASEAAIVMRAAAFGLAGLKELVSLIHPWNSASRRVAEKCGMRVELAVHKWDKWVLVYQMSSDRLEPPSIAVEDPGKSSRER